MNSSTPNPPYDENDGEEVTYFAESDYRNRGEKFGIKKEDRTRHMYIIGKTGMGKTTLLKNMAVQDLRNGNGMAFIDPHGEVADNLLDHVPKDRVDDVMYFAPFDLDHPISFNVMEDVGPDRRHLVADGLLSAFKKIWVDMWSGRMEYLLNNALLALLEYPDATILGVNRIFADKEYRKRVVTNVTDVSVKSFWRDEFANYDERFQRQAASAIQNKVGQFVSNPQVRNIVGQTESSFDVRSMMDQGKIMLINLSKGQVGEDNARLIGSMLITKMYLAAMSRADTGTDGGDLSRLPQFYFYVDEFQSFANESFAGILSEARKYKLNLIIAHQYIEQMTEDVRNAVFGNVGTMIAFRVGAFDAEVLEKEFQPVFTAEDLVNLGFAQIYLKLMLNGVSSKPFSARTLPPIEPDHSSFRDEIRELSRSKYGRPREKVEAEINKWHESTYGIIDDDKARAMAEKQRKVREEGADPSDVDIEDEIADQKGGSGAASDSEGKTEAETSKGSGQEDADSKSSDQDDTKESAEEDSATKDANKQPDNQTQDSSDQSNQPADSDDEVPKPKTTKQHDQTKTQQKQEETVPLSELEKETKGNSTQSDKSPTEANRSKLKAALSGVQRSGDSNLEEEGEGETGSASEEKQNTKGGGQESGGESESADTGVDTEAEADQDKKQNTSQPEFADQISEEELKEMLSVDEENKPAHDENEK